VTNYDVEASATRLSNYLLVLRELVHLSCGHLALEPRFEVKALLADHLHDDARAVGKLYRRITELGALSGPGEELTALLDRANTAATPEYLEIAYGELKPTLIAALRVHLEHLDPLADEPSLRLLTQLLHRQDRHTAEQPAGRAHVAVEDLGALPPGEQRTLRPLPPVDRPQRDPFVEIADEPGEHALHALLNAELCAAELTARSSHERPDMPWDFHADMARITWDKVRHAEVVDRALEDCHWGDQPVSLHPFTSAYALDLGGRLGQLTEPGDRSPLAEPAATYLRADDALHAAIAARWAS
jgi:hypothetical protein